jgi:hypothetical protein
MADGKPRKSPGPFRSKAQWAWAWATHQPFAEKWAHQIEAERGKVTGYRSLPRNKRGNGTSQTRANKIRAALTNRH